MPARESTVISGFNKLPLVFVLVARDRTGQSLDRVTGAGQMSKAQLSSALQPSLARDAPLVSDGNPTYRYFAQEVGTSHNAINLSAGVHVRRAVHIQNVNAYHGRLKQWPHRFHGVATPIWTTAWAGSSAWTLSMPTLGKVFWRWRWEDFHI